MYPTTVSDKYYDPSNAADPFNRSGHTCPPGPARVMRRIQNLGANEEEMRKRGAAVYKEIQNVPHH